MPPINNSPGPGISVAPARFSLPLTHLLALSTKSADAKRVKELCNDRERGRNYGVSTVRVTFTDTQDKALRKFEWDYRLITEVCSDSLLEVGISISHHVSSQQ